MRGEPAVELAKLLDEVGRSGDLGARGAGHGEAARAFAAGVDEGTAERGAGEGELGGVRRGGLAAQGALDERNRVGGAVETEQTAGLTGEGVELLEAARAGQ